MNEPKTWRIDRGLHVQTDPATDFWQRTHYGFQRTNGHALLTPTKGDFAVETAVEFTALTRYDQCGLLAWVNQENWIKCSIEWENPALSRLGSVVTNQGWSDWATQDVPSSLHRAWYRLSRTGDDFLTEFSTDGRVWTQIRMAHLSTAPSLMEAGIYCCSPLGAGMRCRFDHLAVGESAWRREAH